MLIKKITLKDRGFAGIKVKALEHVQREGSKVAIQEFQDKERKISIGAPMRSELESLKYYFLVVTGYWRKEWSMFLRNDNSSLISSSDVSEVDAQSFKECFKIWSSTHIVEVEHKTGGQIKMKAEIDLFDEGRSIIVTTPFISDEDDHALVSEMHECIDSLVDEVVNYFSRNEFSLDQAKEMLEKHYAKDEDSLIRIEEQDDDENLDEFISLVEARGGFVMLPEDMGIDSKELSDGKDKVEVKENSFENASTEEYQEEEEENKKNLDTEDVDNEDIPDVDDGFGDIEL